MAANPVLVAFAGDEPVVGVALDARSRRARPRGDARRRRRRGANASVWFGTRIVAARGSVAVGARSNVQDNSTLLVEDGGAIEIGDRVTIGHNVTLESCRILDGALVANGSRLGRGTVVGGSLRRGLRRDRRRSGRPRRHALGGPAGTPHASAHVRGAPDVRRDPRRVRRRIPAPLPPALTLSKARSGPRRVARLHDLSSRGLAALCSEPVRVPFRSRVARAGIADIRPQLHTYPDTDSVLHRAKSRPTRVTNIMEHLEHQSATPSVETHSPPERTPAALSALCRAAVEDVRAQFVDCTIEYVPDPDRDGTGEWDARRIQYAATVLLEDAVKRCGGEGPVSLRWREYEDEVVLRVQFPRPLEQGDRFVTFFEDGIEPDGADDRVGTLRLVVARKILRQHGGQLARVRTHTGTCYVATWPRHGGGAAHADESR